MKRVKILSWYLCCFLLAFSSCKTPDDDGVEVIDCTNGVQDGSETGVDCGGQCTPCAAAELLIQNQLEGIFKGENFSIQAEVDNYRGTNTNALTALCVVSYYNTLRRYVDGALDTDAEGMAIIFNDINLADYDCDKIVGYPDYFFTGKNPLEQPGNAGYGVRLDWTDEEGTFWFSHKVPQGDDQFFDIYTVEKVNPFNDGSPLVLTGAFNLLVQNSEAEVENVEATFNLFIER